MSRLASARARTSVWLEALWLVGFSMAGPATPAEPMSPAREEEQESALTSAKRDSLLELLDLETGHRERLARLKRLHELAKSANDSGRLKQVEKLAHVEQDQHQRSMQRLQRELGTRIHSQMLAALGIESPVAPDRQANLARKEMSAGHLRSEPQTAESSEVAEIAVEEPKEEPDAARGAATEHRVSSAAEEAHTRSKAMLTARDRMQQRSQTDPAQIDRNKKLADQRAQFEQRRNERRQQRVTERENRSEDEAPALRERPNRPADATQPRGQRRRKGSEGAAGTQVPDAGKDQGVPQVEDGEGGGDP